MATGTSPAPLSPDDRSAAPAPHGRFLDRHLGPDQAAQAHMLSALGYGTLDQLIAAAVPAAIRSAPLRSIPPARAEHDALADLARIASGNQVFRSLIGMGYHDCIVPAVIQRNILENPGWYTQYTPYQAEISQGRLESLLNFQTMVCDLTGMQIANASMLDEGTAAAEAMAMALGVARTLTDAPRFFVADDCHPQTIAVVQTRALPLGVTVVVAPARSEAAAGCFGMLLQYPASSGAVHDYRELASRARAAGTLVIAACDLLALTLLTPPGEWGADVALGNSQRFGVPLGFGGPHAAFLATREELKRHLPGRLVGVSRDSSGAPALRLALQTREQHIRREKATSNICTAQALLANMAAMYAVYHGPAGLRAIAERIHALARLLHAGLARLGCEPAPEAFFDTVRVRCPRGAQAVLAQAQAARLNLRRLDAHSVSVALDERSTVAEVADLLALFNGGRAPAFSIAELDGGASAPAWAPAMVRTSTFLTHAVFNRYHSETEMLRYLRRLEAKDLSLAQAMIPLGSCTMKLNATSEMLPVSWPAFAQLHPFAPPAQTAGYRQLFAELEAWLGEITGFAAVSLQPNAGSQGEYAGLLVIRAYHASRGDGHRRVCLIPTSAHGTNPASAVMAGFSVVAVACDARGNINLADLAAKAAEHQADLACLMVTYPSTHGVFEEGIIEVCRIVHAHGGQVYMDGANMNAQVGLTSPGAIGADVCHLNLHKTFCIPHGGGGPGMGPIGVATHLAPFLPGHVVVELAEAGAAATGAVSAAPWGSASILPISWMYIAMMGGDGLTTATKVAILSANHIARRLAPHFPVLYTGPHGLVAHECIVDLRPLKALTGIEAEDVAKRLMDYGFHAPTLSFPVAGTLMIEPTESESLSEIERFCRAMISIRGEIQAVAEGRLDRGDNPLKHAPHTALAVCSDAWPHAYSRELAAFPSAEMRAHKFWPAVGRIDNVYGDRNLVCSCIGMEAYQAEAVAAP
jgi:glycine dehydrogenase